MLLLHYWISLCRLPFCRFLDTLSGIHPLELMPKWWIVILLPTWHRSWGVEKRGLTLDFRPRNSRFHHQGVNSYNLRSILAFIDVFIGPRFLFCAAVHRRTNRFNVYMFRDMPISNPRSAFDTFTEAT